MGTILCIIGSVIIVALVVKHIIERVAEPFPQDDYHPHPECFMCNDESCIGCPLIEAKNGKKEK